MTFDAVPWDTNDLRLYRFSKRQYVCELAHHGRLWLNPATTYARSGLSMGAYDPSELRLTQRLPTGTRFEVFARDTGRSKGHIELAGDITAELETNYYVFCMSYRYGVDQFSRFDADTCLLITDPDRFINQACKAIRKLLPDWAVDAGTVRYRSPEGLFSLRALNQDIYYHKESRYHPQNEVRIVCSPPRRDYTYDLQPLIVEIGNLHGYTYLVSSTSPDRIIETEHSEALGSPCKCGSAFGDDGWSRLGFRQSE